MFEYQTAISELTGLPVSNASRLRGPERRRRRRLARPRCTPSSTRFLVSRGAAPALARDAGHDRAPAGARRSRRSRSRDGVTDADALRDALGDDVAAGLPRPAELPRRGRGPRGARAARQGGRRAADRPVRPADARRAAPARRLRRRRRASARARRSATGSTTAGRRFGFFAAQEALPAPHAGPDRGRDDRRRRPPRLRAHAADARAAHPPREGDAQHLHRAGAQRARRRSIYLSWLGRRGHRGARRAAAATHRLRARDAGGARRRRARCTTSRSCASSRVALDAPTSTRVIERCAAEGVNPGYPLGATTRSRTACWSRSPSSARKQDIDRLAEVLDGARWHDVAENRLHARPGHRVRAASDAQRASSRRRSSATARRRSSRSPGRAAARSSRPSSTSPRRRRRCPSASAAPSRRSCRRSPSRRSSATTTGSPSATSTSTRASTRSARAR